MPVNVPIGILRKKPPKKINGLGAPPPPPGETCNFIDFSCFFGILGPSIAPEKPSPKSAYTPNPPHQVVFIAFLLKIYHYSWLRQFIATHYRSVGYFILVLGSGYSEEKPNSFSVLSVGLVSLVERKLLATCRPTPE
jgi:hypothetical protein